MAVRMMTTFKDDAAALAARETGRDIEIVRDYPGHEEGVRHGEGCEHYGKVRAGTHKEYTPECCVRGEGYDMDTEGVKRGYRDFCGLVGPLYMETTYAGKVLHTGERNGYHDSDFTVTVWDGEGPHTFVYATTRGWSYPNNATPDATPEVRAAYDRYLARRAEEARKARAAEREREAHAEALEPVKGAMVEVFKGRKVAKGTTGVVIWAGEGHWGPRVGIKDADGEVHWTAATNVRRIIEDKDEGETWLAYTERKAEEARTAREERRAAAEAAAPEVGEVVKVTRGPHEGEEGTVFWTGKGRVGIARKGAEKVGRGYADEDVIWTFGDAVEAY